MIAFKENHNKPQWKERQILLGGSKWNCSLGQERPSENGIYAKVRKIFHPTNTRMDILTKTVSPLDILEEAKIHLQYTTHVDNKKRQKRYLSNMLTDLLNNVDWHANVSLKVHYNLDNETDSEKSNITLHRYTGLKNLIKWDMTDNNNYTNLTDTLDKTFTWDCLSCYSVTQINYVFDLLIYKVDNKPVLKHYVSQLDSVLKLNADFRMRFFKEATISGSRVLWNTPKHELINITLAKAPKLPPVQLVVTSNNVVFAKIHGAVSQYSVVNTSFQAHGQYTLSNSLSEGKPSQGDATTYNWNIDSGTLNVETNGNANITASIFQTVVFNASVLWSGKDVSAILSPPAIITIKPTVKIESNSSTFSRCYRSRIIVDGEFQIARAMFNVHAFGLNIWDVLIASKFHRHMVMLQKVISERCAAKCGSPFNLGPPKSAEEVCGKMVHKISAQQSSFKKLNVLLGDSIYFAPDNFTREDWCGETKTSCTNCNDEHQNVFCSKRYASAKMATALATLVELIRVEFPTRKLIVEEGFQEISSRYPLGKHGESSLFYEGRGAVLSISQPIKTDVLKESDVNILQKLSQLAVCSGFEYVNFINSTNEVEVAVTHGDYHRNENQEDGKESFDEIISVKALQISPSSCATIRPSTLGIGQTYPSQTSERIVCGNSFSRVSRFYNTIYDRLYQYTFDDIKFAPEDPASMWCGSPLRPCSNCSSISTRNSWNICSNRLMTPRAALRLRKLTVLVRHHSSNIRVLKAFEEENEKNRNSIEESSLYREGRALMIQMEEPSSISYAKLAGLAICAGFDFVTHMNDTFLEVFVKPQEQFISQIIMYPSGLIFTGVNNRNTDFEREYILPSLFANESRIPLLIDGQNENSKLSLRYAISDFRCPGYRFLRIDPSIVECLELASDEFGEKIEVLSGYRARSVNLENIDMRPIHERFRFHVGQSVEIASKRGAEIDLIKIGIAIMRMCPPISRPQQRTIGLGCHKDRLYLDFHPMKYGNEELYIDLWNNGGKSIYLNLLPRVRTALKGGPVIVPLNKSRACQTRIDQGLSYLVFQLGQKEQCKSTTDLEFCSKTLQYRKEQADLLQERLSSAAGSQNLPRSEIISEINACIVDTCGGCLDSGSTWDKKVRRCSVMVNKYIKRASRPFQSLYNRATFFNTGNHESTVHSLACHFGFICVENIQIYSLLMPLLTATFRPDPSRSVEERLFTPEDNPSPLLEIISQEMAIRASGVVRVFLDSSKDLSNLRHVLKVLLVHNTNVQEVQFHITENLKKETIKASLQRKIETWSGTTCNTWSRFAVAPYSIQIIPNHRHKRSVFRSAARNHAKHILRNWEYEWLSKI
ncbi:uncharacterized protein LOC134235056 isoform X2 [Saccostrea cucullata]